MVFREILEDGREAVTVTLSVDPSKISTAQQKMIHFKTRRIFTNKKVAAGMRAITLLARGYAGSVRSVIPNGCAISLLVTFYYSYPKGTPKCRIRGEEPMPSGADCDNRYKSVGDALTQSDWWDDDRLITSLTIRKRRTALAPRIVITATRDL